MTKFLGSNNAGTILGSPINNSTTIITLASGTGSIFPSPSSNEMFVLSLTDTATKTNKEICYCISRTGDACTVLRAQEGTSSQSWLAGDIAANLMTSGTLEEIQQSENSEFQDSIVNSVPTNVSAYLNLLVKGLKKTYGATLDGVTDDLVALNNSFAATGKIIEIEDGICYYSVNPNNPVCAALIGYGKGVSILKPGTSVTKALAYTTNSNWVEKDFTMNGTLTTGSAGIIYGDNYLQNSILSENVEIINFHGNGAIGADYRGVVSGVWINGHWAHNNQNQRWNNTAGGGGSSGTPTTCAYIGGTNELADAQGGIIYGIVGLSFDDEFIFQSNGQENLLITPGDGQTVSDVLINAWFEGAWQSVSAGSRSSNYEFRSTTTGSSTARFIIGQACYFNVNSTNSAKAASISGQFNSGWVWDKANIGDVTNSTYQILISVGGYGRIDLPSYLNYDVVVNDTNPFAININEPQNITNSYGVWTPILSSNVGDQSTTFSSVTIIKSDYKKVYNGFLIENLSINANLHAVTPASLRVTLPTIIIASTSRILEPTSTSQYISCAININGTSEIGICRMVISEGIYFERLNGALFPSGASVSFGIFGISIETNY